MSGPTVNKAWMEKKVGTTIRVNNPHNPRHETTGEVVGFGHGEMLLVDFGDGSAWLSVVTCDPILPEVEWEAGR